MPQMKEQEKSPEKELNEMEASNLPNTEFKTLVIKMLKKLSNNFNSITKDIETINNLLEMKNTIFKIKNILEEINNNKLDQAEDQVSDLEHRVAENTK